MKIVGYIAVTIVIMIYAAIVRGCVLAKIWTWFMVRTFGLPALNIPQAIGISIVASFLMHQNLERKSEEKYSATLLKSAVFATLYPIFTLTLGAIVKLWL